MKAFALLLIPALLALGCSTTGIRPSAVHPDEPLYTGNSCSVDGRCLFFKVTGRQLRASPDWNPNRHRYPPLSLGKALRIATAALTRLVRTPSEWQFRGVTLDRTYADKWQYRFEWDHIGKESESLVLPVLLSGDVGVAEAQADFICNATLAGPD